MRSGDSQSKEKGCFASRPAEAGHYERNTKSTMPPFDPYYTAIVIVGLVGGVMGVCAYLTLGERKISAWMQDRIGPNRVGPGGLLQPLADGGKFFLKEEVIPTHVDKVFYLLAPAVAAITAFMA